MTAYEQQQAMAEALEYSDNALNATYDYYHTDIALNRSVDL